MIWHLPELKKKSVENVLQQISLGQTEYYSDNSEYYASSGSGSTCTPDDTTTGNVETALVAGNELFSDELGYQACAVTDNTSLYFLVAKEKNGTCTVTFNGSKQTIVSRVGC